MKAMERLGVPQHGYGKAYAFPQTFQKDRDFHHHPKARLQWKVHTFRKILERCCCSPDHSEGHATFPSYTKNEEQSNVQTFMKVLGKADDLHKDSGKASALRQILLKGRYLYLIYPKGGIHCRVQTFRKALSKVRGPSLALFKVRGPSLIS